MISYPRACVSCRHWGATEPSSNLYTATDRWRWCEASPRQAWSHVTYICDQYRRLPAEEITARMLAWGVLPVDEPDEVAA